MKRGEVARWIPEAAWWEITNFIFLHNGRRLKPRDASLHADRCLYIFSRGVERSTWKTPSWSFLLEIYSTRGPSALWLEKSALTSFLFYPLSHTDVHKHTLPLSLSLSLSLFAPNIAAPLRENVGHLLFTPTCFDTANSETARLFPRAARQRTNSIAFERWKGMIEWRIVRRGIATSIENGNARRRRDFVWF